MWWTSIYLSPCVGAGTAIGGRQRVNIACAVSDRTPLVGEARGRTAQRRPREQKACEPSREPCGACALPGRMDLFPLVRAENGDGIRKLLREQPDIDVNVKNEVGQTPLVR